MKCIAVLSHLMSRNCILNDESRSRADLAIQMFDEEKYSYIITSGWDYRPDCNRAISDVFKEYILDWSSIDKSYFIISRLARDTVGDAYFIRRMHELRGLTDLDVVTSDYHVTRTKKIFETIFLNLVNINVYGAKSGKTEDKDVLEHESRSIMAFERTFKGTNFSDIDSISQSLVLNHPFYNGDVYPKYHHELSTKML